VGGQGEDWCSLQVVRAFVFTDASGCFESPDDGHLHIHEYDVEWLGGSLRKRLFSVGGDGHAMARFR
jgi:hypothetical protein